MGACPRRSPAGARSTSTTSEHVTPRYGCRSGRGPGTCSVPDVVRFGVSASSVTARRGRRRIADDGRRVVGAGDRHRDVLRHRRAVIVGDGDGVDLGDGLALRQRLQHRVVVGEREAPAQRGGDCRCRSCSRSPPGRSAQGADVACVPSAKPGRCALDVDDVSTNVAVWVSIRSRSWNVIVPDVVRFGVAGILGHGRRGRRSIDDDGRRVVGAGDGHRDVLRHRRAVVVGDGDGVDLRDGLALRQRLQHRIVVGEREAPAHRAGDCRCRSCSRSPPASSAKVPMWLVPVGEARQVRARRRRRQHNVAVWVSIRSRSWNVIVPDRRQVAASPASSVTRRRRVVDRRHDGRRVVGAGERHRDVLRHRRAVIVGDGDGVDLGDGLALRQRLQHRVVVGEREAPAHACR